MWEIRIHLTSSNIRIHFTHYAEKQTNENTQIGKLDGMIQQRNTGTDI